MFFEQVELIYPQPGQVEIDPEEFWRRICSTIERSISDAGLEVHQVESLGISTQRSTFITWDTVTGEYYHNFITWKDLRADNLVKRWNSSYLLKVSEFILFFVFLPIQTATAIVLLLTAPLKINLHAICRDSTR